MFTNANEDFAKMLLEHSKWDEKPEVKKEESQVSESKSEDKATKEKQKHICPLCESELKEEISDEKLLEHSAEILSVFESVEEALNESSEGDEDLEDDDLEDEDEDSEEEEEESDEEGEDSDEDED